MKSWIPIVLSTLALFVSVIAQRDKLLSFFDELKKRIAERNERKRALEFVGQFASPASKRQPSLLVLYIPIILISILSSAVLSYLGLQPQFYNTILLSAGVYLTSSMIVLVTFLFTSRRFEWRFMTALFIMILMVSVLWGIFVIIIESSGLELIWSGIAAGVGVILFLENAQQRANEEKIK